MVPVVSVLMLTTKQSTRPRPLYVFVKFDTVSREFNKLKDQHRVIIGDIAREVGKGMADYAVTADSEPDGVSVKTVKDCELYCHYVAGLVGEGLTRLFIEVKFADPSLLHEKPHLMKSMGQLLQQVNITRDVREDYDDKRSFWSEEVWSKYVDTFGELFLPQNQEEALQCSREMVCMGISRVEDCLTYMFGIEDQSTFNFVAIPQAMAIATLELCFQNPELFERNIKISRGSARRITIDLTQEFPRLCEVLTKYAKRTRQKNKPSAPFPPPPPFQRNRCCLLQNRAFRGESLPRGSREEGSGVRTHQASDVPGFHIHWYCCGLESE